MVPIVVAHAALVEELDTLSIEPQTWIVGGTDDSGLATRCLLALEDRFDLPSTVAIDHGDRLRRRGVDDRPARVLAFVATTSGERGEAVDLLRHHEAAAAVRTAPTAALEVVAVALDRSQSEPAIDRAVNLAVTTLIDWGHEIACRRTTPVR